MSEGSTTETVMTSPAESTMATVMSVWPPPYDETTDIREGVTCYKCGKYTAKTWTGLWTHLRLRCLSEEEYDLAKTSWLHNAHRMEERQKEVARRRHHTPVAKLQDNTSSSTAARSRSASVIITTAPNTHWKQVEGFDLLARRHRYVKFFPLFFF